MKIIEINPLIIKEISAFNNRLKDQGFSYTLSDNIHSTWLPNTHEREVFEDYYLAMDSEQVRGGYTLKKQVFYISNKEKTIGYYYNPISEGLIDKKYNLVGVQLLFDALKKSPALFALGMGGLTEPLPKMLASLGWKLVPIPFLFKVIHSYSFLRNIKFGRDNKIVHFGLNFLAFSGLGYLALKTLFPPAMA